MKMVESAFERNRRKEDTGWIVIEKDGTVRKAKPHEVPKRPLNGEGASLENGIVVDFSRREVKKHGKKSKRV